MRPWNVRSQPLDGLHAQARSWEASFRLRDEHPLTIARSLERNLPELLRFNLLPEHACHHRSQHQTPHRRQTLSSVEQLTMRQRGLGALRQHPPAGTLMVTFPTMATDLVAPRDPLRDAVGGVTNFFPGIYPGTNTTACARIVNRSFLLHPPWGRYLILAKPHRPGKRTRRNLFLWTTRCLSTKHWIRLPPLGLSITLGGRARRMLSVTRLMHDFIRPRCGSSPPLELSTISAEGTTRVISMRVMLMPLPERNLRPLFLLQKLLAPSSSGIKGPCQKIALKPCVFHLQSSRRSLSAMRLEPHISILL